MCICVYLPTSNGWWSWGGETPQMKFPPSPSRRKYAPTCKCTCKYTKERISRHNYSNNGGFKSLHVVYLCRVHIHCAIVLVVHVAHVCCFDTSAVPSTQYLRDRPRVDCSSRSDRGSGNRKHDAGAGAQEILNRSPRSQQCTPAVQYYLPTHLLR